MPAIRNSALLRAVIQRVPHGVTPSRHITAPESFPVVRTMLTEAERLAQFDHSRNFRARPVPRHLALVPVHADPLETPSELSPSRASGSAPFHPFHHFYEEHSA